MWESIRVSPDGYIKGGYMECPLALNSRIMRYIENKSALCEVEDEGKVIGRTKIALLDIVRRTGAMGRYDLLSEQGVIVGEIVLTLNYRKGGEDGGPGVGLGVGVGVGGSKTRNIAGGGISTSYILSPVKKEEGGGEVDIGEADIGQADIGQADIYNSTSRFGGLGEHIHMHVDMGMGEGVGIETPETLETPETPETPETLDVNHQHERSMDTQFLRATHTPTKHLGDTMETKYIDHLKAREHTLNNENPATLLLIHSRDMRDLHQLNTLLKGGVVSPPHSPFSHAPLIHSCQTETDTQDNIDQDNILPDNENINKGVYIIYYICIYIYI